VCRKGREAVTSCRSKGGHIDTCEGLRAEKRKSKGGEEKTTNEKRGRTGGGRGKFCKSEGPSQNRTEGGKKWNQLTVVLGVEES